MDQKLDTTNKQMNKKDRTLIGKEEWAAYEQWKPGKAKEQGISLVRTEAKAQAQWTSGKIQASHQQKTVPTLCSTPSTLQKEMQCKRNKEKTS